jgi:gamma-glutamyltranspeptidase/glutathione hydrolase
MLATHSGAAADMKHARAQNSMVATGHPLAAAAAQAMLKAGGSAVDAAVAADAVMGVVEPMATSIGGDLQAMLVHPDGSALTCNGTGRAPAALHAQLVDRLPGGRIPERHAYSVTVPGAVRGWSDLHQRYGQLPWRRLFTPAIEAAENGFALAEVAAREWRWFDHVLHANPHCASLYRAGKPPAHGEIFRNPELARVLRAIASDGPDAFYSGPVACAIATGVQARGGLLDEADLARHQGDWREALRADFCGLTVLECPPNSHGCAVLETLVEAGRRCQRLDPASPEATSLEGASDPRKDGVALGS